MAEWFSMQILVNLLPYALVCRAKIVRDEQKTIEPDNAWGKILQQYEIFRISFVISINRP